MNKWICDTCGQPIEKAEDGWVEWISYVGDKQGRDLRLVHSFSASPKTDNTKCQFNESYEYNKDSGMVSDNSLSEFVGSDGLMRLLVFISENELPTADVLAMIKRVHIPGYEEKHK